MNILDNLDIDIPEEVVSGACTGVDQSGEEWAKFYNIPIKQFKPDWDKFGKRAGPIRNSQMAAYGDILLLIWDGRSRGSYNMKTQMQALEKPVYEVILKDKE